MDAWDTSGFDPASSDQSDCCCGGVETDGGASQVDGPSSTGRGTSSGTGYGESAGYRGSSDYSPLGLAGRTSPASTGDSGGYVASGQANGYLTNTSDYVPSGQANGYLTNTSDYFDTPAPASLPPAAVPAPIAEPSLPAAATPGTAGPRAEVVSLNGTPTHLKLDYVPQQIGSGETGGTSPQPAARPLPRLGSGLTPAEIGFMVGNTLGDSAKTTITGITNVRDTPGGDIAGYITSNGTGFRTESAAASYQRQWEAGVKKPYAGPTTDF